MKTSKQLFLGFLFCGIVASMQLQSMQFKSKSVQERARSHKVGGLWSLDLAGTTIKKDKQPLFEKPVQKPVQNQVENPVLNQNNNNPIRESINVLIGLLPTIGEQISEYAPQTTRYMPLLTAVTTQLCTIGVDLFSWIAGKIQAKAGQQWGGRDQAGYQERFFQGTNRFLTEKLYPGANKIVTGINEVNQLVSPYIMPVLTEFSKLQSAARGQRQQRNPYSLREQAIMQQLEEMAADNNNDLLPSEDNQEYAPQTQDNNQDMDSYSNFAPSFSPNNAAPSEDIYNTEDTETDEWILNQ